MFSSVSADAELREAKGDGDPVGTAQLPPGLDWQAFSDRCFPNGKRHDLNAVVAYFAYQGFGAEPAQNRATREAEQVWEDEGGSTAHAAQEPTRGKDDDRSRPPPIGPVRGNAAPGTLPT
jgi:hypothetical protein